MARTTVVYVTRKDMADAVADLEAGKDVQWYDEEDQLIILTQSPEYDCE